MKFMIAFLALSLTLVSSTFKWGPCPSVALQKDFNINNYLGTWYELVRNKDMPYEKGVCDIAQYGTNSDGTVSVLNSEVRDGKWTSAKAYAYCDSTEPAHCHVKFSRYAPAGDYRVVATDYNNFALVFSCFSIGIAHWEWAWVLARNTNFDYSTFIPQIEALGVPESGLYYTPHENCPSF